ncbi:hypothetical protein ILYODFUR_007106, partial [Ilyodon furcidens]
EADLLHSLTRDYESVFGHSGIGHSNTPTPSMQLEKVASDVSQQNQKSGDSLRDRWAPLS